MTADGDITNLSSFIKGKDTDEMGCTTQQLYRLLFQIYTYCWTTSTQVLYGPKGGIIEECHHLIGELKKFKGKDLFIISKFVNNMLSERKFSLMIRPC